MDLDTIVSVCEFLNLNYSSVRTGNEERGPQISISCPLARLRHKDPVDSNMSCSVKIVKDGPSLVRCFSGSCGYKGPFVRMLELALPSPTEDQKKFITELSELEKVSLAGLIKRNERLLSNKKEEIKTLLINSELDKDIIPESRWSKYKNKYPPYAFKRGITLESCKRWDLGFDEYGQRLVFPVRRKLDKALVGMQGRDITDLAERKHHNYQGFNRQKYLLGEHLLELGKPIVIVEGSTGVVKTDQALRPDVCSVAVLGDGFSKFHAETLMEFNPATVFIFMDGDGPGRAMASKIVYLLFGRVPLRIMECPGDKNPDGSKRDPGNLPEEIIREIHKKSRPVLQKIRWSEALPE